MLSIDRIDGKLGEAQARCKRRITLRQLAADAGVTPHTLSALRVGRSRGSIKTAKKLVSAFRGYGVPCAIESLLEGTPNRVG